MNSETFFDGGVFTMEPAGASHENIVALMERRDEIIAEVDRCHIAISRSFGTEKAKAVAQLADANNRLRNVKRVIHDLSQKHQAHKFRNKVQVNDLLREVLRLREELKAWTTDRTRSEAFRWIACRMLERVESAVEKGTKG